VKEIDADPGNSAIEKMLDTHVDQALVYDR